MKHPQKVPIYKFNVILNLILSSEYLLGEKILAAPVVQEGAVARDIYLPRGTWRDGNTGEFIVGPTWLHDYPAPLDTLPYFTLED